MTALALALIAAAGLTEATAAALRGRAPFPTLVFYLGLIVGLWAVVGLTVVGVVAVLQLFHP